MARETLPVALSLVFGHEGGYVNAKTDKGGPTKYGITHKTLAASRGVASVSADEVKALTLEEAERIYRKGYWSQSGGDVLPAGVDYCAFDFGVNSGPARAVRVLQQVVGVVPDGNVGPQTVDAVNAYPGGVEKLIRDYCDARMKFLRGLSNPKTGFAVNGRGWTIRVTGVDPSGKYPPKPGVVGNALRLAAGIIKPTVSETPPSAPASPKAIPDAPNPWVKPEVVFQGAGALSGMGVLFAGAGPVQWALGVAVVVGAGVAAFYAIRRIRRQVV